VTKATSLVNLQSLEKVLKKRFRKELAERNIAVVKEAYKEARTE
jgi:Pyruvate/2-oxoacid:ferredoxin oxidoreductase gamma subunit